MQSNDSNEFDEESSGSTLWDSLRSMQLSSGIALAAAAALALFSILDPNLFMDFTNDANGAFMESASANVLLASSLVMVLCLMLAASPYGRIRLSRNNEKPEFSTFAWLSMLFAAGMGSGMVFWGVAEPVIHFAKPPIYPEDMAEIGNARMSMVITYLHWALHPWGVYAIGALCISFFSFCKGFAMLPSAPFRAILPAEKALPSLICDGIDLTCVIALLLGLSAAITQGVIQMGSGLDWLGNPIEDRVLTHTLVIILLLTIYLLSAATRLQNGIKKLSETNMVIAVFLCIIISFSTSIADQITVLFHGVIDYFRFLPELSVKEIGVDQGSKWSHVWTVNYLLSWIAWIPFVSVFVARISYGRTIREFVLGVVVVPSLFTFVWFAVMGGVAFDMIAAGNDMLVPDVLERPSQAIYSLMSQLPMASLLQITAVVLVFIFLVTSADSASYVLAMIAGNGVKSPSRASKLFWGVAIAALSAGTLFSESGVHAVRALFSFAGIAVFFIMLGQAICLIWGVTGHSRSKRHQVEYEDNQKQ